ncbi:group III truncated hemoglobin [Antarcticirhabdus aurantiaca]|uniref:Group III truncated hemoglobin n=1 Tax=Antarcticirhabdus aurantiaca TaxID=2606717 RepID=A0ACD4NRX6_9HYPH|nr:group III truncated hemoglobin [Antarcticirhabdus aurantiaca]WAJ29478.1 group III truncated hemoglobin [Jeongeuplla avenae]
MTPLTSCPDPQPLSEAELRRLVVAFYEQVRADDLLAPIFARQVTDWAAHTGRLGDFWCSVMLGTGTYKGNPFGAHLPLRDTLAPFHFERWLSVFREVAARELGDQRSAAIVRKAERIAESLKAGLLFRPMPLGESSHETSALGG